MVIVHALRAAACATLVAAAATAQAGSPVEFTEAHPGGPARSKTVSATLERPEGDGPFPAVVLLHGCAAIIENDRDWAMSLAREGIVTLLVDSFTPRGITETCSPATAAAVRTWDALGALRYLRGLTFVRGDRVGAIGWSEGGGVALSSAQETLATYALKAPSFAAVVAFYPPCRELTETIKAPVLLLLAAKDDWVAPTTCLQRAEALGRARVDYIVYPDATHAFDVRVLGAGTLYMNSLLRYDETATRDAAARVREFLKRTLR